MVVRMPIFHTFNVAEHPHSKANFGSKALVGQQFTMMHILGTQGRI